MTFDRAESHHITAELGVWPGKSSFSSSSSCDMSLVERRRKNGAGGQLETPAHSRTELDKNPINLLSRTKKKERNTAELQLWAGWGLGKWEKSGRRGIAAPPLDSDYEAHYYSRNHLQVFMNGRRSMAKQGFKSAPEDNSRRKGIPTNEIECPLRM